MKEYKDGHQLENGVVVSRAGGYTVAVYRCSCGREQTARYEGFSGGIKPEVAYNVGWVKVDNGWLCPFCSGRDRMTLHTIYQKQIEAWKERFDIKGWINHGRDNWVMPDALLSSHHKDTIELLEVMKEEVRRAFYEFNDKEENFECNQRVLKLRNHISAYLEEQLKLIKKEL